MRVVLVGPFGLGPKKTMSRRALPLARELVARGHDVNMVLPPWDVGGDSGKHWADGGVGIWNVRLPAQIPGLSHLSLSTRMVGRVLSFEPDVVHCFKPKAYSGLVELGLWWLRGMGAFRGRIVVDTDDWEGKGGWNEVARYSACQRGLFAWQERWGLVHADAVTVASRTLETLVWSLGVAPEKVHYVPNGMDADESAGGDGSAVRARHDLGESPVMLLYTRFFEFRSERVVEIVRRVVDRVPHSRLLVVGKGLFGEEKRFFELARQAGLGDAVRYAGWVPSAELPDYFSASDVALYPYDDTLINRAKCSVKLIELMAAGLAIVADRVGQNGEYIEHGESGLLSDGSPDRFAAAVAKVLNDGELRRRLGKGARDRIGSDFSWARLAQTVEGAYRQ